MATPRIGDLIVERALASRELVERAAAEGRARGEPLCTRLLASGVDEAGLALVLAERHGVPGVDLSRTAVALELLDLVPRAVAEADLLLPLSGEGGRIHVAMAHPANDRSLAELRFVTGREVSPYVACRGALARAIAEAYAARARGAALWRGRSCGAGAPSVATALPGGDEVRVEPLDVADDGVEIEVELPAPAAARRAPLVLVERTLAARGYEVELAEDGAQALELAERLVPDLVLLDAMLPRVHGFEACRRLKASPRTRAVPVVMMTAIYRGWRFAEDARDAYGAVDYVEKPFRLEDLVRRVEEALVAGGAPGERPPERDEAADPRLAAGKAHLAAGRVAEAVAALSAAVRADPKSAAATFSLGRALRASGDAFGAMTAMERAAELAPRHLASLRALAALYEETGFRRKAVEVLERALPVAPDDAARGAIREDLLRLIA